MKKQLVAAAIASTLATTSIASISLSGAYEGVWKKGDTGAATYGQKIDLKLMGKHGDSTVVTTFDIDNGASSISVAESYVKTSIAGLSVKGGSMKSLTGNGLTHKKSAASAKVTIGTSFSGIGMSVTQGSGNSNASLTLSGSFGGVKAKLQGANGDNPTLSASTDMSGVKVAFEQNDDTTAYSLGTTIGGATFTYASIDATNATQNDGIFGDITTPANVGSSTVASGLVVSTNTSMGKITGKHYTVNKDDNDVLTLTDESTTTKVTLSSGPMSYTYSTNDVSGDSVSAKLKFSF